MEDAQAGQWFFIIIYVSILIYLVIEQNRFMYDLAEQEKQFSVKENNNGV